MIYHVVDMNNWQKAQQQGFYEAPSLVAEGFIHMSKKDQVEGVLQRYYHDRKNLLLLHIDESKLKADLKFETSPSLQQEFPHLFGRLNLDAVVQVTKIV